MDSLLIYLIECIKKTKKENVFSYKELEDTITHSFRIKKQQAYELIKDMCKISLLIYDNTQENRNERYSIDYDVEKEIIFKVNERRLNEFIKEIHLKNE